MYSQCPECHARFRVGAGDLRAAGGTVRCGRCGNAFNALDWLSDTLPPPLGSVSLEDESDGSDQQAPHPEQVSGVEFHFTASDIESVFVEPADWSNRRGAASQAREAGAIRDFGAEPPIIVDTESRPFEDITLEGEGISVEAILGIDAEKYEALIDDNSPTDEFETLRDVPDSAYPEEEEDEGQAQALDEVFATGPDDALEVEPDEVYASEPVEFTAEPGETFVAERDDIGAEVVAAEDVLLTRRPLAREREPDSETSLTAVLKQGHSAAPPRRSSFAWSIGGLLLVVALLAQVAHYFRQDLVRHPQVGPLLKDVYARIGWPLSPNWDLAAFELRQWGNGGQSDAQGQLAVRASLTNRASFAQPHPILRLELDDRFGDPIAVRDFEPADYLKNPDEASRLLEPGASAEAELMLVDPGRDAVGYQLDVCLRESATLLRCAQEAG